MQTQVVGLLRGLQGTHGLTYLFASHDLKVVKALEHYAMVMRSGKIVGEAHRRRFLTRRRRIVRGS